MTDDQMDEQLLDEFIIESQENLDNVESDFLTLEHLSSDKDWDGQVNEDAINEAFRCVHSIKGGAGFAGLQNIANLAHSMETLMDLIRKKSVIPDKKNIDIMLKGVDLLSSMFKDVKNSDDLAIEDIQKEISDYIAEQAFVHVESEEPEDKQHASKSSKKEKKKKSNETILADIIGNIRVLEECHDALEEGASSRINTWIDFSLDSISIIIADSPQKKYKKAHEILENLKEFLLEVKNNEIKVNKKNNKLFEKNLLILKKLFEVPKSKLSKNDRKNIEQLEEYFHKDEKSDFDLVVSQKEDDDKNSKKKKTASSSLVPQSSGKSENIVKKINSAGENSITSKQKSTGENETIRVKVSLLNRLMTLAGELVLIRNQQLQLSENSDPAAMRSNSQKLNLVTTDIQECVLQTRMQPVGSLFQKFHRIVRDLGKKLNKEINLEIAGGDVEIDKSILEALSDPLTHLIRNACDHGIETPEERAEKGKIEQGHLNLSAWHEGGQIHIEVRDDGSGIDHRKVQKKVVEKGLKTEKEIKSMSKRELTHLILLPGLSTTDKITEVSGRGVGMDVVKSNIEKVGGTLDLDSALGEGTAIRIQLPLTLAIIPSLVVQLDGHNYAIPQVNLEELVTLYNEEVMERIETTHGKEVFRLRDTLLPMVRLKEILMSKTPLSKMDHARIAKKYKQEQLDKYQEFLQIKANSQWGDEKFTQSLTFVVLKIGHLKYGLIVDRVIGTEEIVVKSMHPYLKNLGCYAGAAVMGDGKVAPILDILGVLKHSNLQLDSKKSGSDFEKAETAVDTAQSILLFRSGAKEQFGIHLNLVSRIERISSSNIQAVGAKEFITIDDISTRVIRLDSFLNVSKFEECEQPYLLLPKATSKPFGILISNLVDILEYQISLTTDTVTENGMMGTAIINEQLTIFIDLYELLEKAEPGWGKTVNKSKSKRKKKRILLVEDIPFFQTLVGGYLRSGGHDVVIANNGRDGLDTFKQQHFDLVVSDIEMPVMNGFDFMRNLRTILNDTKTPSLALTSLDSEKDRETALECGFDAYEVKIDREKLLTRINEILES
jgi:two-component system chemotaxis sensor kinase CheA